MRLYSINKTQPMKKITTQNEHVIKVSKSENMDIDPQKDTLDFLQQFARVYTCEPRINGLLGSYILN